MAQSGPIFTGSVSTDIDNLYYREVGCDGGIIIDGVRIVVRVEKREIGYPWRRQWTIQAEPTTRMGGRVQQDPVRANICGTIVIPVIQSQSVIVK